MRYRSIDILRAMAIVIMVLVHFSENLAGEVLPIATFGAPMFAFLAGVNYRIWLNRRTVRAVPDEEISKVSIRRGLFVVGVGFVYNVAVWLPEDTYNWDVLTLIGASLLILNLLRRQPLVISVLVGVLCLVVAPVLRSMADYPTYWNAGNFEPDLVISDVIVGFLSTGYFPLFPWLAFPVTGFVTASLVFPLDPADDPEPPCSTWPFTWIGLGLLLTGNVLLQLRPLTSPPLSTIVLGGWSMFPPATEYVLATLGMALAAFSLTHRFVDAPPISDWDNVLFRTAKLFSKHAFTVYLLHHFLHVWPLWLYGSLNADDPTQFWRNAMPLTAALPLAVVCLVVCYVLLRQFPEDGKYSVEWWMRWLCD